MKTYYKVVLSEARIARFTSAANAQEYARWYSEVNHQTTEVVAKDGLIGQYKHGAPTPEFRGRGDEWYPAGVKEEFAPLGWRR